jgi:hypothetical protein
VQLKNIDDDDDVYLINYNMAVGYKIYLHTNTDQPERHKHKMNIDNYDDNDDVYLEYYAGKGFHINHSCLHVLRKTHKLVQ